ncbi:unnamed protein product [Heterobilharzia americana]|nr:unnamed protein product [Heterobilharzia americana]
MFSLTPDPQKVSYFLCGSNLSHTATEKELGLIAMGKLDTSSNYPGDTSKAYGVLYSASRQLSALTPELFLKLYKTYIRPHLEVHNVFAPPQLKRGMNPLDKVQRRVTKGVVGMQQKLYEDKLKDLGLYSVSFRRLRGDLIMDYKILNNPSHPNRGILPSGHYGNFLGSPKRIAHQRSKTHVCSHFFLLRVCGHWNALPTEVVSTPSVESFEKGLDSHSETHSLPKCSRNTN